MNSKAGVFAPQLNGAVDLSSVRNDANQAVYNWIDGPRGDKALCIDRSVFKALLRLCNITGLDAHGVRHFQALEPQSLPPEVVTTATHFMFLVRNTASNAQLVAQHIYEIRRLTGSGVAGRAPAGAGQPTFWVAVYPQIGLAFQKVLERAELLGDVHLDAMPLHFLPYDTDTLTMLRPSALKELMADNNPAILHDCAQTDTCEQALVELMRRHGLIKRVRAVGRNAVKVATLLESALREAAAGKPPLAPKGLSTLVIFDRQTDLATPLLSQFTTEGVFDDAFDLAAEAGFVYWNDKGRDVHQVLNNKVEGWRDVRTWPFVRTLGSAPAMVLALKQEVEQQRGAQMQAQAAIRTITRMKAMEAVVDKSAQVIARVLPLPLGDLMALEREQLQSASRPAAGLANLLARSDVKFAEDTLLELLLQDASLEWALRLLLLRVICKGPFEDAALQHAVKLLLAKFGFQHILTLTNLQAAGLLPSASHKRSPLMPLNALFATPDRVAQLRLFEPLDDSGAPASPTPYLSYNPLSARLVRQAMLYQYMPNPLVEYMVQCSAAQGSGAEARPGDAFATFVVQQDSDGRPAFVRQGIEPAQSKREPEKEAAVVVMMVGGCTFAEMTAMRAEADKNDIKLVIVTSAIINGNSFIRSFIPDAADLATLDAQRTAQEL